MRSQKFYMALNAKEQRIVINSLNKLQHKSLADGRYTDAVDDVLIRIVNAPIKKFKLKITEGCNHGKDNL